MEFISFKKNLVGDGHVEMVVVAKGEDVTRFMEEAYKTLAQASGLNPNDPIAKLRSKLINNRRSGEELDQIIKGYTLSRFVPYVIDSIEEETICEPMFYCKEEPQEDTDLEISIVATLKPQFELTSYEPVVAKVPVMKVTEEEINEQLQSFAESYADYRPSTNPDAVLGIDGFAMVNITIIDPSGNKVDALSGQGTLFQASYDSMPREFIDKAVGMRAGEMREFEFQAAKEGAKSADDTETFKASIAVTSIMDKVLPEITDAWFKRNYPMYESLEAFKENLTNEMERKLEERRDEVKGIAVDYAILERFSGTIPDEIFEFMTENMTSNFYQNLQKMGLTKEQFFEQQNTTEAEYVNNMMIEARRALRQSFCLDAIFRERGMELSDQDIHDFLTTMAPGREDELLEQMKENGRTYVVMEEARRHKAHRWLIDTATYEYVEE